jgi:hypothetical protein
VSKECDEGWSSSWPKWQHGIAKWRTDAAMTAALLCIAG